MAPALFIPETLTADEAFALLQQKRYHVAIVLDAARQTLTTYVDGKLARRTTDLQNNLEDVLPPDDRSAYRVFLGKSSFATDPLLNAKLRDVRVQGQDALHLPNEPA